MNVDQDRIVNEPVPGFDVVDLFLSHTDQRGVIAYGNDVFRRLSEYDWSDLLNAPHRIIRHPDMPRAVFRLFWETLQNGQTFAGYVKNRSATGRYYWVFAVAVPVADGYLSVRLKPTSDLLETIASLYANIREAEVAHGQTAKQGVAQIAQAVTALGYRDYAAFAGYALGQELGARANALGRRADPTIAQFASIGALLSTLATEVGGVVAGFEEISDSPQNLNILGSQLKSRRGPMQVVAQNYGLLADEIMGSITELAKALAALLDIAYAGRVDHCAALLYREAITRFVIEEPNRTSDSHLAEHTRLITALEVFEAQAAASCDRIKSEVARFASDSDRLRRMISGLAVTRIICLIEARSVMDDTTSIEEISRRLATFQGDLSASLDRITALCHEITKSVPQVEIPKHATAAATYTQIYPHAAVAK